MGTSLPPIDCLCCPETGQRLTRLGKATLARLEAARREGNLLFALAASANSSTPGSLQALQVDLAAPIEAALVREDGKVAYPVQKGIPILLPGHGIVLEIP